MAKVVVTAQVLDSARWEKGFRTHADLFRGEGVTKPIHYAIDGNEVAVCVEPDDLDKFLAGMRSTATAEAMDFDGIKRETVKMYVLDREFRI